MIMSFQLSSVAQSSYYGLVSLEFCVSSKLSEFSLLVRIAQKKISLFKRFDESINLFTMQSDHGDLQKDSDFTCLFSCSCSG